LDAPEAVLQEADDAESILLCEWFAGAPAMCRVEEECLGLDGYGRILTVLKPIGLPEAEDIEEERQRRTDRSRGADWRSALRAFGGAVQSRVRISTTPVIRSGTCSGLPRDSS
jgi:hypothetical protein